MDALIKVENLSFSYDGELVLEDISFELERGKNLGIIGPNGGGKSTLLKLIGGLLTNFTGEIFFNGRLFHHCTRPEKGEMAYLSCGEKEKSILPLTCEEFILSGEAYQNPGGQIDGDSALRFVDLFSKKHSLLRDLSGGQKQRVALARCLLQHPLLFLFDEPTRGLDGKGQDQLIALVERAKKLNQSVIVVDHNIEQLLKYCDDILCLNKNSHWHDKKESLTKDILKNVYHCEFEHELLHEREGPGPHHRFESREE